MAPVLTYTVTVKRRRGGGRDRFGDPLPATVTEIGGCVKWPRSSTETADFSQQVATGYMLHVPAGTDLVATDEILFPGEPENGPWWTVDGDPLPWGPSPFTGSQPGILAALTRATG